MSRFKDYDQFSKQEEARLYARMKGGDMEARRLLIESQVAWVRHLVAKFCKNIGVTDMEDAESTANLHLIQMIDNNFDPERGRLTTLVSLAIPRLLQRYWNKNYIIKIPQCPPDKCRFPDALEVAKRITSIHADPDTHRQAREIRCHDPDHGERIDREESFGKIESIMKKLTRRERDIVRRRMNGESLASIGETYGISKERVRQIEAASHNYIRRRAKK